MRNAYLVFTVDENGELTIRGAFTNRIKSLELRFNLQEQGLKVISETVKLNTEAELYLANVLVEEETIEEGA